MTLNKKESFAFLIFELFTFIYKLFMVYDNNGEMILIWPRRGTFNIFSDMFCSYCTEQSIEFWSNLAAELLRLIGALI